MLDGSSHVAGFIDFRDEFHILNALADGGSHLVCVNDSGVRLPLRTFGEEIVILRKKDFVLEKLEVPDWPLDPMPELPRMTPPPLPPKSR